MKTINKIRIEHRIKAMTIKTEGCEKGPGKYYMMKRLLTLLTAMLIIIMMLNGAAYSENIFESEQFKSIITQSETEAFKPKIIFTIGELFTFEKGHDGFYKDYEYKFAALPATYLDFGFILAGGLTLGMGGTVHYDIFENIFEKSRTFGWAAGGSLFYYFGLKNKVIPYLGFKYFFGQESFDVENKVTESRLISNTYCHSMYGTGGILFRCTKNFGIYFEYSYIYKMIESDMRGPVEQYTGSYHKASMGFKVLL